MTGVLIDGLTLRRRAIEAAIVSLTAFGEVLPEAADGELGDLLGTMDRLAALSTAACVAVTAAAGTAE